MNEIQETLGVILFFDGRYWLSKEYNPALNNGAYYASPVYTGDNGELEVRHCGGNWLYKTSGVKEVDINNTLKLQIYRSHIKHLRFVLKMCEGQRKVNPISDKQCKEVEKQLESYLLLIKNTEDMENITTLAEAFNLGVAAGSTMVTRPNKIIDLAEAL